MSKYILKETHSLESFERNLKVMTGFTISDFDEYGEEIRFGRKLRGFRLEAFDNFKWHLSKEPVSTDDLFKHMKESGKGVLLKYDEGMRRFEIILDEHRYVTGKTLHEVIENAYKYGLV